MKQLSDNDIAEMIGNEYVPDDNATKRSVRAELKLSQRIPAQTRPTPKHVVIDLHMKTIEDAWGEIMAAAKSGVASATIITGASGVLHELFPVWARESLLTPYIIEFYPINNGSFSVRFHRNK